MLEEDLLDEHHRAVKPVTLGNYTTRVRVLLTTLVEGGVPVGFFSSLNNVVDPAIVKRGFELRLGGRPLDDRTRQDLHSIAVAVLSMARFLGVDDETRGRLKQLAKKVRFRAKGMCEKNRRRLIPLFDPTIRRRLLRLPLQVASELGAVKEPTVRQVQRMQNALLLDLLLHVPMRIRNAAELDLQKTIIPPLVGGMGSWRISV
jgi:hypothetical protein